MDMLKISLIIISVVILVAMIVYLAEPFKPGSNASILLSVTAQTTPGDVAINTQEELDNIDSDTTILDSFTLDKVPVLRNAIDQAHSRFVPSLLHDEHTYTTLITQDDANAIMQLAGDKITHSPVTQTSASNFGENYTENSSNMEFRLDNFYYSVVIQQVAPSQ